ARFALEAAEQLAVFRLGRRQHLDRHDLAEVVDAAIDARHATFAEPVEDAVLPEKKVVGVALEQQRRLVLGQILSCDQPLAELTQITGVVLGLVEPALVKRLDLLGRKEPAADDESADIFDSELHEGTLAPADPAQNCHQYNLWPQKIRGLSGFRGLSPFAP